MIRLGACRSPLLWFPFVFFFLAMPLLIRRINAQVHAAHGWVATLITSLLHDFANLCATTSSRHIGHLQEGKSDIEFLREEELVNGLHVSSRSYKPNTCYQISPKGKVRATCSQQYLFVVLVSINSTFVCLVIVLFLCFK